MRYPVVTHIEGHLSTAHYPSIIRPFAVHHPSIIRPFAVHLPSKLSLWSQAPVMRDLQFSLVASLPLSMPIAINPLSLICTLDATPALRAHCRAYLPLPTSKTPSIQGL